MASTPLTLWHIAGEIVEAVTDFLFLGSKITVDGDCSRGIRRQLLLVSKTEKSRQCVEKQRHYCAEKIPYSKGYDLPIGQIQL